MNICQLSSWFDSDCKASRITLISTFHILLLASCIRIALVSCIFGQNKYLSFRPDSYFWIPFISNLLHIHLCSYFRLFFGFIGVWNNSFIQIVVIENWKYLGKYFDRLLVFDVNQEFWCWNLNFGTKSMNMDFLYAIVNSKFIEILNYHFEISR